MNMFLKKIKNKSSEQKIAIVVLGVIIIAYLIFLKKYSESIQYLTYSLIFYGCMSILYSRYFFTHSGRKYLTSNFINVGILYIYFLNLIVFPITVFMTVKYIDKLLFPMNYLFEKIFTLETVLTSLKLIGPYFLAITLILHLFYTSKLDKREIHKLKLKNISSSLKYHELKAQLSPHFLFNNLSVLTSLIEESPKKAIPFSENLSMIYRYFLDKENEDIVLLKDELDFASKYIQLLKDRFENAFNCTIIENYSDENAYILPLAIQQLIENVIKHNEVSLSKPIHIIISINKDCVIVENNINPKLNRDVSSGLGISNIQMRYTYFTEQKIKITQTKAHYKIDLPILKL